MDSTQSGAKTEMDEPQCNSHKQTAGKRAAVCLFHGWNMTYKEIRQRGCIDPRKQRGKIACKHLVKDADNIVWFNRWMKAENKRDRKAQRRINAAAETEEAEW